MKSENEIYPKSVENISALVNFYFSEYELNTKGIVEEILAISSLSLNDVKLILESLSNAYPKIFKPRNINDLKIMFSLYGVNAYKQNIPKVSKAGLIIFNEFKHFMHRTDLINTSND